MAVDNTTVLIGNLVDTPELRFTTSGTARAQIRVAVNERKRKGDGEWREEVHFFRGVLWGSLAEHAAESFAKGARVIMVGRLQQRTWETDRGERRSVVEMKVTDIGPSLRWATADVRKTGRPSGAPTGGGRDTDPF